MWGSPPEGPSERWREMARVAEVVVAGSNLPRVFVIYIREDEVSKFSQLLRELGVEHQIEVRYCG